MITAPAPIHVAPAPEIHYAPAAPIAPPPPQIIKIIQPLALPPPPQPQPQIIKLIQPGKINLKRFCFKKRIVLNIIL